MSVAANGPETDCARGRCAEEEGGALLQLGGIRATEARHARVARREHMKYGDPPD